MGIRKICKNRTDFSDAKGVCLIRYLILADKTRTPMKRKPGQTGCEVFMYASLVGQKSRK